MKGSFFRGAWPAAALALAAVAHSAEARSLPDFDVRAGTRQTTLEAPQLEALLAGAYVRLDSLTGTASRVLPEAGALSAAARLSPEAAAHQFLAGRRALYGLTGADAPTLRTVRMIGNRALGVTHLTLGQEVNGIPVAGAEMVVNVDRSGRVLSTAGSLVPQLMRTVGNPAPQISAGEALRRAAGYAGADPAGLGAQTAAPAGRRQAARFAAGQAFVRAPEVSLAYFPLATGQTVLAWDTTLWPRMQTDIYHVLVDASTGRLLWRKDYTSSAGPQGLVYDRDAPQDGTPYLGFIPPVLDRVLAPFDGSPFFTAGDPHLDWFAGMGAGATVSNNALAFVDRAAGILSGGTVSPVGAPGGNFSFSINLSAPPSDYQSAAAVNLFYWNNRLHDFWYQAGFDEASGNFQDTNFGRGGVDGDGVFAAAQFGADTGQFFDNAQFATEPDGGLGVMFMFEFDLTAPHRDGDLSAQIMGHEFFHGVSGRLCGNANGLAGFQGGALGEGLSDFASMMALAEPGDNLNGVYPQGGYVLNEFAGGIRSQPYSAVPGVFTRTYKNIGDAVPGVGPEVHLAGEIIANTMWEMYVKLATKRGFLEGRRRAAALLINALKLGPPSPTFVDLRNSLLQADVLSLGGDSDEIWAAFAGRGMGLGARTKGVNDVKPVESFMVPPALDSVQTTTPSVKGGKRGKVTVVMTGSASTVRKVSLTSSNPAVLAAPRMARLAKKRTSVVVAVKSKKVSAPTDVTVTASFNGVSRNATIRVTP